MHKVCFVMWKKKRNDDAYTKNEETTDAWRRKERFSVAALYSEPIDDRVKYQVLLVSASAVSFLNSILQVCGTKLHIPRANIRQSDYIRSWKNVPIQDQIVSCVILIAWRRTILISSTNWGYSKILESRISSLFINSIFSYLLWSYLTNTSSRQWLNVSCNRNRFKAIYLESAALYKQLEKTAEVYYDQSFHRFHYHRRWKSISHYASLLVYYMVFGQKFPPDYIRL